MSQHNSASAYTHCLTINRLRLAVHLGCEKEERKTPQPVDIDLTFFFPSLTEANLKDTGEFVCYDKISQLIKAQCEEREFRLIEFLGMQIHHMVREVTSPEIKIGVKITKCRLPVAFVLDGASFIYSDLPPHSWVVPG